MYSGIPAPRADLDTIKTIYKKVNNNTKAPDPSEQEDSNSFSTFSNSLNK